jgi:hypothetical protein
MDWRLYAAGPMGLAADFVAAAAAEPSAARPAAS